MHSLTLWQLPYSNAFWLSRPGVCYYAKALIGADDSITIDVQKAYRGLRMLFAHQYDLPFLV